jgi:predicted ester cyclase
MSDHDESVIRSYYRDAFGGGKLDITVIDQYMVADFVAHDLILEQDGREGYKQFIGMFAASFSEINQLVIGDMISCNDKVVARWSWSGKHTAEFMGVPATDRHVTMKGIDIFRLTSGEIADLWQEIDFMGILQQIIAPAPNLNTQPHLTPRWHSTP